MVMLIAPLECARAAPHSVDELLREPTVRGGALSEDGKHVVLLYRKDEKSPDMLYVIDADHLDDPHAWHRLSLGAPASLHARWVEWATSTRLLIGLRVSMPDFQAIGSDRIEAVDSDGMNPVVLFSGSTHVLHNNFNLGGITARVPDDPTHVIMSAWSEWTYDLYRVDVMTGEAVAIARGRPNTVGWDAKDGRAVLRYDSNGNGNVVSVYGRTGDSEDKWALLTRYHREELIRPDWSYAGPAPGAGRIFILTRREDSDASNIYTFDVPTKSFVDLVAKTAGYDMAGAVTIRGAYLGARYIDDTLKYVMADAALQKHLDGMNAHFRNQANVNLIGLDSGKTRMLVYVHGPRDPGDYYLYEIPKAKLEFLMSSREWLEPTRLASVESRRIHTRDDAFITAYLTRPAGLAGALPMVVMPHGGPEERDQLNFDPIAQSFAAQGWLVLQPNFRGSGGYGHMFTEAGHRQWARRMQDDVTDAVHDVVEAGLAKPDRIVIYGGSYGGYAALAGGFVTPDLYKAIVARAGVSDLVRLLRLEKYERDEDGIAYRIWSERIGDLSADGAAIRAASPIEHARDFRAPVLLLHGTGDFIVPVEQSRLMKTALEHAGRSVRLEEFEGEGHTHWSTAHETQQMNESIEFFKRVLQ
jgi:dipeptidyl aminopeptidase/acylaminoacyl peptidase